MFAKSPRKQKNLSLCNMSQLCSQFYIDCIWYYLTTCQSQETSKVGPIVSGVINNVDTSHKPCFDCFLLPNAAKLTCVSEMTEQESIWICPNWLLNEKTLQACTPAQHNDFCRF